MKRSGEHVSQRDIISCAQAKIRRSGNRQANITNDQTNDCRKEKQRVGILAQRRGTSFANIVIYPDGRFRETALPQFLPERFLPFPHD